MSYEEKMEEYHRQVSDLADRCVQEGMADGKAFSEALCDEAISEAERIIPKPEA